MIQFRVIGIPVPQPRPRTGGVTFDPKVRRWKKAVMVAAMRSFPAGGELHGRVNSTVVILIQRPKSHFTADGRVKRSAPQWPCAGRVGDIDNYEKSVLDACADAGVFACGDGQITRSLCEKAYAQDNQPGALVTLVDLPDLRIDGRAMRRRVAPKKRKVSLDPDDLEFKRKAEA